MIQKSKDPCPASPGGVHPRCDRGRFPDSRLPERPTCMLPRQPVRPGMTAFQEETAGPLTFASWPVTRLVPETRLSMQSVLIVIHLVVVTALVVWYFFSWQTALVSIPVAILCGYIALRSSETLIDLTIWVKSAWLLFRQRALFLRLLVERETLQKEIGELIE